MVIHVYLLHRVSREGAREDKGQDTQLQMLVPLFLTLRPLRYISSSKNNLKLLITKNKKYFFLTYLVSHLMGEKLYAY